MLDTALATALEVANANAPPLQPVSTDQLAFLRQALNTASIPEVKKLIADELLDYHAYGKIELKRGTDVTTLDPAPRHYLFKDILELVENNLAAMLIGPAGSGKSTVCKQVAEALGMDFYLQNSITGVHELAGFMDAYGKYNSTAFRKCFEHGGTILVDEIDTGDAGATKWLNTALANGYAMFPDKEDPVLRHPNFRIVAAANTFGTGADRVYVGANQLDASTLDRFVFVDFGYDEQLELLLSGNKEWCERVQSLREAADKERARVVISPRATITGAKLLSIGWAQGLVEERLIWRGMDKELRERIENQVTKLKAETGMFNGGVNKNAELRKARKEARKKLWA